MKQELAVKHDPVALMRQEDNMNQLREILGSRAPHYVATIAGMMAGNPKLQQCKPESILVCAMKGAALDLSFDPALGEAYMLPFKGQAVFDPGYKGLIALALRTGQFVELDAKMVTNRMYRELRKQLEQSVNPHDTIMRFFAMIDFFPELHGGQIYGFVGYFRLKNGFSRVVYWDKQRCLDHGLRYSPSAYTDKQTGEKKFYDSSAWITSEDAMCLKTVIRELLKFAPKSKDMKRVFEEESDFVREQEANPQRFAALPPPDASKGEQDDIDMFGEREEPEKKFIPQTIQQKCEAEAQRLKGLNRKEYDLYMGCNKTDWTVDNWTGALLRLQQEIQKAQSDAVQAMAANVGQDTNTKIDECKELQQGIIVQWDMQDYQHNHRLNSMKKEMKLNDEFLALYPGAGPEELLIHINEPALLSDYLEHLNKGKH